MSDSFSGPGSALGIQWADYKGALLLFTVKEIETGISTQFGTSDAVRVSINVLDGSNEGDGFADVLVFPKVLQGQLRGSVGGRVLGRLGQGEKKSGQNAPWKLEDPTEDDKTLARKWIAENDKPPF